MADECEGQGKRAFGKKKIGIVKDRVMNNQKRGIKREKRDGGASEERLASILEKRRKLLL